MAGKNWPELAGISGVPVDYRVMGGVGFAGTDLQRTGTGRRRPVLLGARPLVGHAGHPSVNPDRNPNQSFRHSQTLPRDSFLPNAFGWKRPTGSVQAACVDQLFPAVSHDQSWWGCIESGRPNPAFRAVTAPIWQRQLVEKLAFRST